MPELPEVETIRRGLSELVLGKKIVRVEVGNAGSFLGEVSDVVGREIVEVGRMGKALLIKLDDGKVLMVHLRMTGQLIYVGKERFAAGHPTEDFVGEMPSRHTRVSFEFEDGSWLYFNDQRKFGFVKVLRVGESDGFLDKLGSEPWDVSEEEFYEALKRRKGTTIKAAILDQSVIAGVGNIYADEGLWAAAVAPMRRVGEVSREEAGKLLMGIRGAMEKAIEVGGSSLQNYVKADGTRGDYLDKFAMVFDKTGEKCARCGDVIEKTRVAGRGTHWCPKCQR